MQHEVEDRGACAGRRVATVVTGGNLTAEQMHAWLGVHLPATEG